MTEPLTWLWPLLDLPAAAVTDHDAATWPAGVHQQLVARGFLRETEHATRVLCPECHNHWEDVVALTGPEGQTRYVSYCPEVFRVVLPPAALRQWTVDGGRIAAALAGTLHLSGRCTELATERLWRLGRWTDQGVLRDILLARGLHLADAREFRRALSGAHRPVIFVGSRKAPTDYWNGRVPPQILLSEVATWIEGQLELDVTQIFGLVRAADEQQSAEVPLTAAQFQLMVRQQVKAEGKSQLTDDVLVAAYQTFGSLNQAVAGLLAQGVETNRWAIERAVKRAGGPQAVRRGDDSESVVRTVASRRRDSALEKRDSNK